MTFRIFTRTVFLAWKYVPGEPVPVWVARRFHNLGDGTAMHTTSGLRVRPGEYCLMEKTSQEAGMMTADEYRELVEERRYFEIMPDEAPEGYEL